jgi:hypothetical protein
LQGCCGVDAPTLSLSVVFDEEEGSLHIEVSTEQGGRGRYFVPDTTVDIGVGNVGMFANDVAYTGGCTEEEYDGATARMSGKSPTTLRQPRIQTPRPHALKSQTSGTATQTSQTLSTLKPLWKRYRYT